MKNDDNAINSINSFNDGNLNESDLKQDLTNEQKLNQLAQLINNVDNQLESDQHKKLIITGQKHF